MSEGRCGADIGQIREAHPTGELEWLEKFDSTCGEDAGHEGPHVFQSQEDGDERLHWDEAAKRFSSYQGAPPAAEEKIVF